MHIERIVIQGFKTYKNMTIINSFSPHHNVVVGRNGSGKSNFFAAIRFVLSDAYTNMTREERQSLIHEGSGTVMSAYVEIIFDNTDRRIPIDKDEVAIRRTIGMKKDDYSLDSKSATKSDIMNLLESAGFSKSNPYYIVPQGRVTALTNAKDTERLQLLKEVAGAKVFETKLKDSQKEMTNTNKKREQIDEMLRYIESRLDDLDMEKNDLKAFDKLNTKKKILEFNLFDRELTSLNDQIETIESDYVNTMDTTTQLVEKMTERERTIKKIEAQVVELNSNKKLVDIDKKENDSEIQEILGKIGQVTAQLKEEEVNEGSEENILVQLQELKQLIQSRENELKSITPQLEQVKSDESTLKTQLREKQQTQRALFSKRGRSAQFSNVKQRNNWLKQEIRNLNESLTAKNSQLQRNRDAQVDLNSRIEKLDDALGRLLESEESEHELAEIDKQLSNLKLQYNDLLDERKRLWREESKLNSILHTYEEERARAQHDLGETMDRSLALGLEAVQRICKSLGLTGVYGTLGELIDVSEKYKTAVEVVGGNSLFHVVVDNDQTASLIMDELIREKAGRVTFMPLNRLHSQSVTYPDGSDSVPLIKKIAFEDYLAPAVNQVFSKTVVSISLVRGAEIARTHKLNAITLDGDRCDKKGVLTGGYRDQTKSRVDFLRNLTKWKSEIYKATDKLDDIKKQITIKDSEITQITEKLNTKRKELDTIAGRRDNFLSTKNKITSEKSRYQEEISALDLRIEQQITANNLIQNQINEYKKELKSDFKGSSLTEEEEYYVKQLTQEIPGLEKQYGQISDQLEQLSLKASSLTSELNENLYPRLSQLNGKVAKSSNNESSNFKLQDIRRKLNALNETKANLDSSNIDLMGKTLEIDNELNKKHDQLQKLNDSQRSVVRKLENSSKASEKSLGKKILLTNRREEVNKKIGDLGVLPDAAFSAHNNTSSADLLAELNDVTEQLREYSHVNKKALEQFVNFGKQRDSLVTRRAELDQAKSSIEELISVLEKRKNDAIIRTFKEVSIGFSEIFEKLVPAGTGKLIIQRRNEDSLQQTQANEEDIDSDEEDADSNSMDSYVGISISVSFNSKKDEQQRIEQLSGGQKSLCAIALILAIQRCDPAPFYLFDEIDANLDTQYRTSVAKLINDLAQNAQFICTTFRPEMLKVSDKFFGVMFNNKVSTVSEITREDALGFIEGQQRT